MWISQREHILECLHSSESSQHNDASTKLSATLQSFTGLSHYQSKELQINIENHQRSKYQTGHTISGKKRQINLT